MTVPPTPPSMRGAIDLAALAAKNRRAEQGPAAPGAIDVDEESLQALALRSRDAPVLIAFVSVSSPASEELASRLAAQVPGYGGAFILGVCDIDAQPAIAQAFQIQAVPAVMALIGGRPAPLFQGSASDEQIREVLDQVLDVARQTGMGLPEAADRTPDVAPAPEALPPLHQEAFDAIEREDYDAAMAAYDKALRENPKDADARAGRAQVRLVARTLHADLVASRAAAAAAPTDFDAQCAVADLDVLGGKVEDAFARLIDLVRLTSGDDRDAARERLVELFDVVGGDDERVLAARRALASALF